MIRSFDNADLMLRDDGRTVEGRIVPYNEIADVAERINGEIVRYQEMFLPRSCARLAQVAQRRGNAAFIEFRIEHDDVFDTRVGYATSLRDESDGAYATFRLYENKDIEKVRSMLTESHTGLSVHFGDFVAPRLEDGITKRVQVHIDHVAATPVPVYAGAGITSIRDDDDGGQFLVGTPQLDEIKQWLATVRS